VILQSKRDNDEQAKQRKLRNHYLIALQNQKKVVNLSRRAGLNEFEENEGESHRTGGVD
jgi:hypothetical protein